MNLLASIEKRPTRRQDMVDLVFQEGERGPYNLATYVQEEGMRKFWRLYCDACRRWRIHVVIGGW